MSLFSSSVDWTFPVPIHYGPGRLSELSLMCISNDIFRPLIVTDRGSVDLPFVSLVKKILGNAGLSFDLFSDVSPNPIDKEILIGKEVYKNGQHDGIIAIGGGSGMDAGKAISLIALNEFDLWQFDNDKAKTPTTKEFPPLICIPTTAGTGAETESTAMITNSALGMKLCVWHPNQKPIIALLDPTLSFDLPRSLTAWTGVDAIVHAVEAYTVDSLYSVADAMAIQSLSLLGPNLIKATNNPHDLEARGAMLIGSCLAGISFLKGLGLVHAISHMVGAIYDTQHGLTNAILLPPVLRFNKSSIAHKIKVMNYSTFSSAEGSEDFYTNICNLLDELEIPKNLYELKVDSQKSAEIASKAIKDSAARTNPRQANIDELKLLVSEAINDARC